jgi:hypothetical protein
MAAVKSNTYSERALAALSIKHAIPMRHIFTCGLPDLTVFFYFIS